MTNQPTLTQRLGLPSMLRFLIQTVQNRLLLALLGVSLIPLLVLATWMYYQSSKAVMNQAYDRLTAVRTIKANQIESYFRTIHDQILTFSEDQMVIEAMAGFRDSMTKAREENSVTPEDIERMRGELNTYYSVKFSREYQQRNDGKSPNIDAQFGPLDDDSIFLQYQYIRSNPNPLGSKEASFPIERSKRFFPGLIRSLSRRVTNRKWRDMRK